MSTKTRDNREQGKSKPSSTAPNPLSDYANPAPCMAFLTRLGPQQPFLQKQQFGTTSFRVGGCYVCGDFTHFQRECLLIVRSRSGGNNKTKSKAEPEASEFVKDEYLLEQFEQYEYKNQNSCSVNVKGRLRTHLQFWKNMCAYDNILEIIKNEYKIPFYNVPQKCFQKNNSALLNSEFVERAILELLEDGLNEECVDIPFIVNPLTVSVQSNGKKRLILDLGCVNLHILKQSVKYEDIRTALVYFKTDSFMFSFDLHAAYHRVEMFYPRAEFLGFSWVVNGKQKFFLNF